MSRRATRKFYAMICIIVTILSVLALGLLKLGNYVHADSYNEPYHEKYSECFNDMQQTQITAARKLLRIGKQQRLLSGKRIW